LQPLIDRITASAGALARAKGLRLAVEPTSAWVRSDRALLGRMISNIVENAVRYTEQGRVTISCAVSAGILRLDVRDTGPGIAAQDTARIWQEFEQLHNTERDRRQGLGLGLAIVRRLSRILVHPVHVASIPGQGSCFTIEIPTAEPVAVVTPPAAPVTAAPRERLAIVVEDDVPLLSVLGMILEDHGWRVVGAADEQEALEQLAPGAAMPDVILTDYRLRDGKLGSDAILIIRKKIGRAIPAIILTGEIAGDMRDGDGPQRDAERLGGVSVLRKPVSAAVLIAALTDAIAVHG
jgi:two-component system, sensor histidine kinase